MMKKYNLLGQRGTLLVEAIAMLGLIAIVTPTLYKKSAERMQEIQDINVASQARTMNSIIEAFVKSNFDNLMQSTSADASGFGGTVELSYMDNSSGSFYPVGYSAFVPFGYSAGDLKNYGNPRVFVHRDGSTLVSYVVFPATSDPGQKRAARIASLVGANGGSASKPMNSSDSGPLLVYGTGGAWKLDADMLSQLGMVSSTSDSSIPFNSLVVTAAEPITLSNVESEKFLFRVPAEGEGEEYHNAMVTDLYMGGTEDNKSEWSENAKNYYSIWNVRRLTLNTECTPNGSSSNSNCNPGVADLYIGKPEGKFKEDNPNSQFVSSSNTGAAWVYGNLSALKNRFKLYREGSSLSDDDYDLERDDVNYDVLEFSRMDSSDTWNNRLSVLRATNEQQHAQVGMINDFVVAREDPTGGLKREFLVGDSSVAGGEGGIIRANSVSGVNTLKLNSPEADGDSSSFVTEINRKGGTVYIGGRSGGVVSSNVYINEEGGVLQAGPSGRWMRANGSSEADAKVDMFLNPGNDAVFTVGKVEPTTLLVHPYDIEAKNGRVSLNSDQILIYDNDVSPSAASYGSTFVDAQELQAFSSSPYMMTPHGATVMRSKWTNILSNTYIGSRNIGLTESGSSYARDNWQLTVAGDTLIDGFLWADEAWFNSSATKEFHSGYSSYAAYKNNQDNGWFHATASGVKVKHPVNSAISVPEDMLVVEDRNIYMSDLYGATLQLANGAKMAYSSEAGDESYFAVGTDTAAATEAENYARMVGQDKAEIYTRGNSSYVDIQQGGLRLKGIPGETYQNTIRAQAGTFSVRTNSSGVEKGQFLVNSSQVMTNDVEFIVSDSRNSGSSSNVFWVRPNSENTDHAQVQINGTLHVNNNDILHIASNPNNQVSSNIGPDRHAMLEIDPNYVQIWSKSGDQYVREGSTTGNDYYAMLRIDPNNVYSSSSEGLENASIYIRKGAIELEKSVASDTGSSGSEYAADQGYGFITANRFVSNTGEEVPSFEATGFERGNQYDTYMVNPAYTSVMHDIKLTTRGGARLSDILPDYVLKGVYNLINNYEENRGSDDPTTQTSSMASWADPYIGIIPFASCPPGYNQLATIVPISFNMGQAGDLKFMDSSHIMVDQGTRQVRVLESAINNGRRLAYPNLEHASSYVTNYGASSWGPGGIEPQTDWRSEGWFMGFDAVYNDGSSVGAPKSQVRGGDEAAWEYDRDGGGDWSTVVEPLYFQQNTWLKTSVVPETGENARGWHAYMGFLYDKGIWSNIIDDGFGVDREGTVVSNANDTGDNSGPSSDVYNNYVWNLFGVPTNSLEGHATVYCYFDRKNFKDSGWENLVDPIDQLGAIKNSSTAVFRHKGEKSNDNYVKRLNDPSLKYTDPW